MAQRPTARPASAPAAAPPAATADGAGADAGVLAAPDGWTDITDEIAEVRFLMLQGFEQEATAMLDALRTRFPGHPDLDHISGEGAADVPDRRRRDQAVTVRTEPVATPPSVTPMSPPQPAVAGVTEVPTPGTVPRRATGPTSTAAKPNAAPPRATTGGRAAAAPSRAAAPAPTGTVGPRAATPSAATPSATTPAPAAASAPAAVTARAATSAQSGDTTPSAQVSAAPASASSEAGAPMPAPRDASTPIVDRPPPATPSRNASRVPPRGLTIRAEAVSTTGRTAPPVEAAPPAAATPVVAAPNPANLVERSVTSRPVPSPADSVSETLEFDVDADFFDNEGSEPDAGSGVRPTQPPIAMSFDDAGETSVDLELERLDRTVVSRSPPAPPVFDDEPTGGVTESRAPAVVAAAIQPAATPEGTVIARAPSAPAPWSADGRAAEPVARPRTTVIPDDAGRPPVPAPFGGGPPAGSTLVPGTTPPPGGFDPSEDAATIAVEQAPPRPATEPTAVVDPSWAPAPVAPAAPPRASTPPLGTTTAPSGIVPPQSAAAATPAPARAQGRGRGRRDTKVPGIRVVMLGARGEAVAERTVEANTPLDLGRADNQPWADDPFIEPMHVRLSFVDGGLVAEELVPSGAVFLRIQERKPLREQDQVRVGQSLLIYHAPNAEPSSGPWGSVTVHVAPEGTTLQVPLGGAGLTVGREFGEVTLPGDTFVSSTHCRVVADDRGLFIEDLESSNGTYLRLRSGERVEVGQCILVGQTQFVVRKR